MLTKKDYQSTLYQHQVMMRMRRLEFLQKLPFFSEWDRVSLVDFNNSSNVIRVDKGDTIYDIGQSPTTFYVVKEGKLTMETIIEIDSYFKFPVDRQVWEVRKQTRRIQYKLQDLAKGAHFGHEEMLQGFDRRCRVRAISNCTLIYINAPSMMSRWPPEMITVLRNNMRSLDLDYIVAKINKYVKEKTKRNQAVLDAAQVNCHDFSGGRSKFMENTALKQADRILPWITKARQNTTKNQNLLHELRKVKLLSFKETKFTISKGDMKEDIPTEEFLSAKHSRFVLPSEL